MPSRSVRNGAGAMARTEDVFRYGALILALNRDAGVTVLLVEQKLPFARRVASEFCILEKGRSVAAGPIDRLTDDVVHAHLSV